MSSSRLHWLVLALLLACGDSSGATGGVNSQGPTGTTAPETLTSTAPTDTGADATWSTATLGPDPTTASDPSTTQPATSTSDPTTGDDSKPPTGTARSGRSSTSARALRPSSTCPPPTASSGA
ncbi:hypothetical protein [Nannocystis radixulma]|uniref:Uncharacterized protein n=1 Tax=Nannocystis radixulma TaxID=2995305 RepID=A0ABT5BEW4_9BACT|nr:hypothetical protein [Nannocystis radixulma]MDC0671963.1 hypothetical protein [Nannocystis radixulma]